MSMTSTNSDSSEGLPVETPCGGSASASASARPLSRYESQKRRDWNTFGQYLRNHRPPLVLSRCSGAHVLEFLRYLDQFGKTKVHVSGCPFFGHPQPPAPCSCPLRQAWGSLDALIGRLRAAFEENGGHPEANPFGARAVRLYLREVRETQAKARGIAYEKKKRKRPPQKPQEKSSTTAVGGVSPTPEMVVPGFAPTTTEMVQCSPAVAPSCLAALPMLQLAEWNQVYGGGGYPYQLYQYQLLDHGNGYMAAAAAAGAAPPPMAEVGEIATHNTVTT